jgi:hypothetical protein
MSEIKITWKAFEGRSQKPVTSVEFTTDFTVENHEQFCDVAYHCTNVYGGNMWTIIKPLLSPERSHTALSVGDEVTIDGSTYICADFGWEKVGA